MTHHRLILAVLLVACASHVPLNLGIVDEYPYVVGAGCELKRADYDGDGVMDVYAVRSERCNKWLVNGCTGEMRYVHRVTITQGGSNGSVVLREVIGVSDSPIEAVGWSNETGNIALKVRGRWQLVPWTAPRGERGD